MVNVTNETKGITRRSLLKTTALLAGTAALAPQAIGCSTLQELPDTSEGGDQETVAAQTQEFLCCCHGNCDNDSCSVYVTVRDGKVVNLRRYDYGDIEQQGCCQRCYGNIERMYSDRRILHPMRRVGERGSGEFEIITWDEAIEDICTNLKRVADVRTGVRRVHARLRQLDATEQLLRASGQLHRCRPHGRHVRSERPAGNPQAHGRRRGLHAPR